MKVKWFFCFLMAAGLGSCRQDQPVVSEASPKEPIANPLFEMLPPAKTGITFANNLKEGLNTNILMYEYFYNGGGVATADFNGDGLIDIYFTSNMEGNKLYLNKGNMTFADVTSISGTQGRPGPWKTGVTYADVNADGRLDLYVCYSGTVREENRANQLFINEGNNENNVPIFKERAAEYGINSVGYSNQGYFFDYDKDSDLDLLLLNHNPQSMPVLNEVSTKQLLGKDDPLRGVRLFRQQDLKFEDVTNASGISSSALTYALGAGIADVDNDGWDDIYISNDYAIPDYLYINKGDGKFSDMLQQRLGHTSHFSMGNDVADINNDGAPEILTLDMLPEDNARQKLLMSPDNYAKFELSLRSGFYYQYMRNMLQLNNGDGTFSEVGQIAGVSNTDWSWAALFADYDNDGFKDLFVTNGYVRDYTNLDFIRYMDDMVKQKGRLKRQDVVEMISHMPSSNVNNYIYSNNGGITFTDQSRAWGMNISSNSNGAAYADLDNDGDLDLVVNNINQPAFVLENKSSGKNFLKVRLIGKGANTLGIGAKVSVTVPGKIQVQQQMPTRGYLSAVSPCLHFGIGEDEIVDSVTVVWASGVSEIIRNVTANTELILKEENASKKQVTRNSFKPLFAECEAPLKTDFRKAPVNDFKRQPQLISQFSHRPPVVINADVDGDGREDIFYGSSYGVPAMLFLQEPSGAFRRKLIPAFNDDVGFIDADAAFLDFDNDGDADIYVASGGYHNLTLEDGLLQDRLYVNDGKGNYTKAMNALPTVRGSKGCVAVADVNGDGLPDIFVGGRVVPGEYPKTPQSFLMINQGDGTFVDEIERIASELQRAGMITDAAWVDMDQDSQLDLVVTGEWMPVSVFVTKSGKLINETNRFFRKRYAGWWNTLAVADLNNDRRPDIVAGNFGLNSQFRATEQEPVEMFFSDFDNNGSVDPIITTFIQGKNYPYLTRDEMLEQLGYLRARFPNYSSFASITLPEIFKPEDLARAGHLSVNHLETTLFLSGNDGFLNQEPLPIESQFSCVNSILLEDFDHDGKQDMLLCGNNSTTKLKIGKLDANSGIVLKGNGSGKYTYLPQSQSGLKLQGDIGAVLHLADKYIFSSAEGVRAYNLILSKNQLGRKEIAQSK